MMEICCECDWGLGGELPPHLHRKLEHIRWRDGREFWMPAPCKALNPDAELLATWEEVHIFVDWQALYRANMPPPKAHAAGLNAD